MRRGHLIPACLVVCAVLSTDLSAQSREDRWRQDLDFLKDRLTAIHPNLYTRTTPEAFEQAVAGLRDQIPALSDPQILVGMSRVVAMANDSHTILGVLQSMRRYPLGLRWFSDGLFVVSAPDTQTSLIGRKVVRLAGRSPEEVEAALKPFISHDTDTWYREINPQYMVAADFLVAAGLLADRLENLTVTVETSDGTLDAEVVYAPVNQIEGPHPASPSWPLYRQSAQLDYWMKWLPESSVLYVKYNRCRQSGLLPIPDFGRAIIEAARANQPRKVVFDIRDNPGGSDRWLKLLLQQLGDAFEKGEIGYPEGGFYAIISKRTFSSGSLAAVDLKKNGAVMVGETTGGNPTWYGDTTSITLPYSRFGVSISQKKVIVAGFEVPVKPDIELEFRGADYFAERDPYLAAILER